jgi:hypothetical protein
MTQLQRRDKYETPGWECGGVTERPTNDKGGRFRLKQLMVVVLKNSNGSGDALNSWPG